MKTHYLINLKIKHLNPRVACSFFSNCIILYHTQNFSNWESWEFGCFLFLSVDSHHAYCRMVNNSFSFYIPLWFKKQNIISEHCQITLRGKITPFWNYHCMFIDVLLKTGNMNVSICLEYVCTMIGYFCLPEEAGITSGTIIGIILASRIHTVHSKWYLEYLQTFKSHSHQFRDGRLPYPWFSPSFCFPKYQKWLQIWKKELFLGSWKHA